VVFFTRFLFSPQTSPVADGSLVKEQAGTVHKTDLPSLRRRVAREGSSFQNTEGIDMIWCSAGSFQMGSPWSEKGRFDNETQHKVTLTQGYWLAKTELTQAQWQSVMGSNPSEFASSGLTAPVENISWEEAMEYCRRLTVTERVRGASAIPPGWEYSLPTEAQWEYACRAGSKDAYSFGNDPAELDKYGNYYVGADGRQKTAPVGTYADNKWGFFDMHGNVNEWCRDAADENGVRAYAAADAEDPLGSIGSHRVNRGGGFNDPARYCGSAIRDADPPSNRSNYLGFRPALVPLSKQPAQK
jgi:formylglycine-generating enzyme required for sulfatase activity